MDSAVDGTSDTRIFRALVVTALRATTSPLIPLHVLIRHLLIILFILLLRLLNSLAITVKYLPVVPAFLHVMSMILSTTILSVLMKGLGDFLATTINYVPETAITVKVN